MALDGLGIALGAVGRSDEAITAYQDAAAIYRQTGDRHGGGEGSVAVMFIHRYLSEA